MSDLALFKGGLPAYLKNAQDDATNALAGESLGSRRISIKGNVFREFISPALLATIKPIMPFVANTE